MSKETSNEAGLAFPPDLRLLDRILTLFSVEFLKGVVFTSVFTGMPDLVISEILARAFMGVLPCRAVLACGIRDCDYCCCC